MPEQRLARTRAAERLGLFRPGVRRVALVGADQRWMGLTPWGDRTWNVWAHVCLSAWCLKQEKAADVWFDIHRPEIWHMAKTWHPDYLGWLRTVSQPVVMQCVTDEAPTSVAFPFHTVRASFGPDARFGSTFDWMLMLAVLCGAHEIALHGIEFETLHEAVYQKPLMNYWVGYARGRGVRVTAPEGSRVLADVLPGDYGPDFPPWPDQHHPT